jgi:hypothetical protein
MTKPKLELRGGRRPQRAKPRRTSFTARKQAIFFAELAATCNVSAAARKARISDSTVYEHRLRYAAFRARWLEAVRESYARLELAVLDRSLNGTVKTVTRADGSVDRIHEYPNAMALQLLRQHRETAAAAQIEPDPTAVEEARRRIARKLERLAAQREAGRAKDGPKP